MGTPAVWVTFSCSIRRWRLAPSRKGPGSTRRAPTSGQPKARPQLLAALVNAGSAAAEGHELVGWKLARQARRGRGAGLGVAMTGDVQAVQRSVTEPLRTYANTAAGRSIGTLHAPCTPQTAPWTWPPPAHPLAPPPPPPPTVEHGHHGQQGGIGFDVNAIGQADGQRVQEVGAVGVEHSFGIACKGSGDGEGGGGRRGASGVGWEGAVEQALRPGWCLVGNSEGIRGGVPWSKHVELGSCTV